MPVRRLAQTDQGRLPFGPYRPEHAEAFLFGAVEIGRFGEIVDSLSISKTINAALRVEAQHHGICDIQRQRAA